MTLNVFRFTGINSTLAIKGPVRCATTSNIALIGLQAIDGVTLVSTDTNLRVLVKNQTDARQNGIYDAQSGNWTRSTDWDTNDDFISGTRVIVAGGTTQQGIWVLTTADPITVGTSSMTFVPAFTVDFINSGRVTTFDLLAPTSTEGDLIYNTGVTNTRLPAGTPGQPLITGGSSSPPSWLSSTQTSGYQLQANGVGTNPSWAGFLQAGTGAVTRTWNGKALYDRISVLDFIAETEHANIRNGTSATDLTTSIQAAINYIQGITFANIPSPSRPALYFPSGYYTTGALTCTGPMAFIGDGMGATVIKLKAGVTSPLFTCPGQQGSDSTSDYDKYVFAGMYLVGNRTDSVSTGTSHGLFFPDTSWSLTTQYTSSLLGTNLRIESFTGNAIHLGVNRNAAVLVGVNCRYCNDNGMASNAYDCQVYASTFGGCKNYGVRLLSGGNMVFHGCNMFFCTFGVVVNSFVNFTCVFDGCQINGNKNNGASVASATAPVVFMGCSFDNNSTSGANTFSDIIITDTVGCQVIGCGFIFNTQTVKYLVETAGAATDVYLLDNSYSSATPYGTGVSNDFTKVNWLADTGLGFRLQPTTTGMRLVTAGTNINNDVQATGVNPSAQHRVITPGHTILLGNNDSSSIYGIFDTTNGVWAIKFDYALALANVRGIGINTAALASAWAAIAAGDTSHSQINFAASVAPTSPNNGDFWFDGTNFKARVGGVTKTFTIT